MAPAIKIWEGRDFYVPAFTVKVGHKDLPKEVVFDVIQVTYKDSLKEVESFQITVNNWDADKRKFKYSDLDLFAPENEVELSMGYKGDTRVMVQGKIKRLSPTFPAGGQPTLAIGGLGPRHDLRGKQESHVYEDMTDTEVAKEIAGRLGVQLSTDPEASSKEERFPYLIQDNQLDIVFLTERARRIGYELYIDASSKGRKIYFGPSTKRNLPEFELVYGKSLIQFAPSLDTSNQVYQVKVTGSDPVKKEPIEKTVTRSDISVTGLGCAVLQKKLEKAFRKKEEVVSDASVNSVQEATTLARELLQDNAKQMVKGSGSTVGVPELRAGTVLRIGGLDECFSGRYFVTGTTHTIGGKGYTTKFDCRLEEI